MTAGPSVAERIARYRPVAAGAATTAFATGVAVRAGPPNWPRAKAYLFALMRLGAFAEEVGLALDPTTLLSTAVIERCCTTRHWSVSPATRRTVRSNLLAVARGLSGGAPSTTRLPRERAKAPYSSSEIAAYLALAAAQPTRSRRLHAGALVCLGAGAGLTGADLRGVRGTDVVVVHGAVAVSVTGRRSRRVPVLVRYQPTLLEAAEAAGVGYVIGGRSGERRNVTTPLVSSLAGGPDIGRLDIGRLRATWLCEVAGLVGLSSFMAAAGITCSQRLGDLVAGLGPATEARAVVLLGAAC